MQIRVIRSGRRTIAIEINQDLQVIVRAPMGMRQAEIQAFVESKNDWITKHLEKMRSRKQSTEGQNRHPSMSGQELQELAAQASRVIPERVAYYARIVGVTYGRITIRNQKTRWGSCSSKGNLNFNCLLMLTPPEVLDYVVVHELCHRKEMNHSARFWAEVEHVLPDYEIRRKWLRENGTALISRLER